MSAREEPKRCTTFTAPGHARAPSGSSPSARGGSQGNLCLDGNVGRFVGPGQIINSGAEGSFALIVDLSAMPTPNGPVAVQAGETWSFQAWHRDSVAGSVTSNFTDAVSITFRQ